MPATPPSNTVRPKYSDLEKHYPKEVAPRQFDKLGGTCKTYVNQCAIRMSSTLQAAGIPLDSDFETKWGPTCSVDSKTPIARGAKSLADSLWKTFGAPVTLTSSSSQPINGKKGIVYFKELTMNSIIVVHSHIDLWDGSKTKGYNPFVDCSGSATVWFWELL